MNQMYLCFQDTVITPLLQIIAQIYIKQYMYQENVKEKINKNTNFIMNILGYLYYFKYILKGEESICTKTNEKLKFDKFNIIYEHL